MKILFPLLTSVIALSALTAVAPAQVSTDTVTKKLDQDITEALLKPEAWATGTFDGQWKDISTQADKKSRELVSLGKLFGEVPQQVQLYIQGEKVQRLEIIFLEAGNFFGFRESKNAKYDKSKDAKMIAELEKAEDKALEPKRKEFAALFTRLEKDLPVQLEAWCKGPGKRVSIGRVKEMRVRGWEFASPDHRFRFTAQDDQLLSITIIPSSDGGQRLMTREANRKTEVRAHVEKAPNGDVMISNIPMFNQGGRGYCAMGTLAMIMQYYGMNINVDQLAARAGYKDGDTENSTIIPIYQAAAKEAKLRYTEPGRFTNKGRPILVWRWFSRERDEVHRKFKQDFAAQPELVLPDPRKDREDKRSWPDKSTGGHASLVTGFNKERSEIIFAESWGENNRDRRMRAEEMEATAYAVFVFEP
jgi:hypothetical protein